MSTAERIIESAWAGDLATVKEYILSDPSSLEENTVWRKTPLHLAAEQEHLEMVKYLVEAGRISRHGIAQG